MVLLKAGWILPAFSWNHCFKPFFPSPPSRSVEDEERPFALGMQFVLLRTLGMSLNSQLCLKFLFVAGKCYGPLEMQTESLGVVGVELDRFVVERAFILPHYLI